MKKLLFLLIIILCSCSSHKEDFKDYIDGNFIIKNGEQLLQNEEYEVIYTTKDKNANNLSLEVFYQTYDKNSIFQQKVYRLKKIDSIHYQTKIKILPNTSWIYISSNTERAYSSDYLYLPVYRKKDVKEIGANEGPLLVSNKETYLNYFYDELKNYPNNISIYASRWRKEIEFRILNKDTVLKHINYLEKNNSDANILPLLQVIAYTINYDSTKLYNAINLTDNLKETPFLNSWALHGTISNIIFNDDPRNNDSKVANAKKKIIQNIAISNPLSFFSDRIISGMRYKYINPNISIQLINKIIEKRADIPLYQMHRGLILSKYFIKDSSEAIKSIVNQISKVLNRYNNNNDLYYSNCDPDHSLYIARGLFQSVVVNLANYTKEYDQAIEFFKETLKHFEPTSNNTGMTYDIISEFYLKNNQLDSGIKYLYYAHSLFPTKQDVKYRLDSLIALTKGQNSLKKLDKLYSFPKNYLSKEIPNIQYQDGSSVNLLNIKEPKIVIFFSLSCSVCTDLVKEIAEYNSRAEKKIYVVLLAMEPISALMRSPYYSMTNTKIVTNPIEILRYFEIGVSAPEYIVISRDNLIVSKGDGYGKNNNNNWGVLFK